jgi:hypothetical protein
VAKRTARPGACDTALPIAWVRTDAPSAAFLALYARIFADLTADGERDRGQATEGGRKGGR